MKDVVEFFEILFFAQGGGVGFIKVTRAKYFPDGRFDDFTREKIYRNVSQHSVRRVVERLTQRRADSGDSPALLALSSPEVLSASEGE